MFCMFKVRKSRYLIILFLLIHCALSIQSQTNNNKIKDSLLKVFSNSEGKEKANVSLALAKEYDNLDSIENSVKFLKYALSQSEYLEEEQLSDVNFEIGREYYLQGKYIESLSFLFRSANLYDKSRRYVSKINSLILIAKVFNNSNQYELAKKYINSAQKTYKRENIEIDSIEFDLKIIYGNSLYYQNLIDSSKLYNQLAYQLSLKMKDPLRQALCLNNLAVYNIDRKEFKQALDNFYQIINILEREGDYVNLGNVKNNIACVYFLLKDYKNAEKYFLEVLASDFKYKNGLSFTTKLYLDMSLNYESMGNVEKALHYYKLYSQNNDSLLNEKALEKMNNVENKYQMALINSKNNLLEEQNRFNYYQKIVLTVFIFLFIILGGLIYRNMRISLKNTKLKEEVLKKKTEQLDKELKYKGKELETFAHKIIQKNEVLEQLHDDINKIKSSGDKNLKDISRKISDNLYLGKENIDMEGQLNVIQQSFLLHLKEKHSTLSKSEVKMCSMLLLGMSTKDIANALNISYESAKKNRHRIRKKLNLTLEDNLEDYLKSI